VGDEQRKRQGMGAVDVAQEPNGNDDAGLNWHSLSTATPAASKAQADAAGAHRSAGGERGAEG
jgi:hypothetical protein